VVLLSRALVTVSDRHIAYRFEQTFLNDNDETMEGLFFTPTAGPLTMVKEVQVNGTESPYEVLRGSELRGKIEAAVRIARDPALIELAKSEEAILQTVKIGPHAQKSFRVDYEVPRRDHGMIRIDASLIGERYSIAPVGRLEYRVRFKSSLPVRNIFSPTHHLNVVRETPYRVMAVTANENKALREDFTLFAGFSDAELDVRALVHRPPRQPGTFMILVEPFPLKTAQEPPKDVALLADVSGSMSDKRSAETVRAAVLSLGRVLRRNDRFNVLTIGTRTTRFAEAPVPATETNLADAYRFFTSIRPGGGTDLCNGIVQGLEQLTSRRRRGVLVIVGDGRATIGTVNLESVIQDVRSFNKSKAVIYGICVGNESDTALLDAVAKQNQGSSIHISGADNIEEALNRFWGLISAPLASNITVDMGELAVGPLIPDPAPDIFGDQGAMILGEYGSESGVSSTVTVKARSRGKTRTATVSAEFPAESPENGFIRDIKAMRTLAALLEKERIKGVEAEDREHIQRIARAHGFKIPPPAAGGHVAGRSGKRIESGGVLWSLKNSRVPQDVRADDYKRIRDKVFRTDEAGWTDTEYRPSMPVHRIAFLSEEYFDLLRTNPECAPILALGPEVTFRVGSGWARVYSRRPN
jgi:Ca-activated chloride channel family protein